MSLVVLSGLMQIYNELMISFYGYYYGVQFHIVAFWST